MLGANRPLRLLCVYVHQYSGRRAGVVVAGGVFHFIRLWMRRLSFFTRYWGGLLSQKQYASGDSAVVHSFGAFPVQRDYPSAAAVDVHGGNFRPLS